jgi:hypothetical protein
MSPDYTRYRSVVVEDSLIADGMFGPALFTPPVLAALRELFEQVHQPSQNAHIASVLLLFLQ